MVTIMEWLPLYFGYLHHDGYHHNPRNNAYAIYNSPKMTRNTTVLQLTWKNVISREFYVFSLISMLWSVFAGTILTTKFMTNVSTFNLVAAIVLSLGFSISFFILAFKTLLDKVNGIILARLDPLIATETEANNESFSNN